jgi:dTDP-4-amino-4,6-dideoxygalactose transaminase
MKKQIISFVNLSKEHEAIHKEIMDIVSAVLIKGQYILGENVQNFELALAEYCGAKYVVGVGSGTDALVLSLLSLGVQAGDEVITTPFTFPATINAIIRAGATPVLVDIDKSTFNIKISQISQKITPKTKVVLPVHLFGQACNLSDLNNLTITNNLHMVEDAAQAIGAHYKHLKVGSIGTVNAFSFYPTKNLGAFGDAGAVITNEKYIYDFVRTFRAQGARIKGYNESVGMNSRLDELQAAILLVKLKYLDKWILQRRQIARNYTLGLADTPLLCPQEKEHFFHTYYQYAVLAPDGRDLLKKYLSSFGIETKIYYQFPIYSQPAYKYLGYRQDDFPTCQYACEHIISLPCYPELTWPKQKFVIDRIKEFFQGYPNVK